VRAAIREKLVSEVDEADELEDGAEPQVAPAIEDHARTGRS